MKRCLCGMRIMYVRAAREWQTDFNTPCPRSSYGLHIPTED